MVASMAFGANPMNGLRVWVHNLENASLFKDGPTPASLSFIFVFSYK